MILLLDNYDSFTYNLYQFIAGVESKRGGIQKDQIDSKVKVVRNDQITPEKILELAPEALVISPGPGKPSDSRNLYRSNSEAERKNPDARRLSRTSGNGRSVRSNRRSRRTADAWEDITAERRKDRQCPLSESDTSNPGGKISFARSKGRDTTGRTDCDSAKRGQRDHGDGTQRISNLWVTVSSGICDDTAGTSDDRELY